MLQWVLILILDLLHLFVDAVQYVLHYGSENKFITAGFAPIDNEVTAHELAVDGSIPEEVYGEFVRNGPNPRYVPTAGYHWFDGDGMLHGVRLSQRGVSYVNRYVRTKRFLMEGGDDVPQVTVNASAPAAKKNGAVLPTQWVLVRNIFPRLGQYKGVIGLVKLLIYRARALIGQVDPLQDGDGTSNTAVVMHAKRLLALVENDKPYLMHLAADGALETIGRYTFHGKLNHPFTAHPKVDRRTGEMMFFGYSLVTQPHCQYSYASAEGELMGTIDVGIPAPVMMHDMAITENYSIILDFPLQFIPQNMIRKGTVWYFNPERNTRIGLIRRHIPKDAEVRWFEFTPGFSFHTMNAWEEGDEVVIVFCRSDSLRLDDLGSDSVGFRKKEMPFLHEYRINVQSGECSERRVGDTPGEFPVVPALDLGYRGEVGWMSIIDEPAPSSPGSKHGEAALPRFNGVVRVDLAGGKYEEKARLTLPAKHYCGEWQFVPKKRQESPADGFLMSFVTNEASMTSYFWIIDAETLNSKPIATVELPQRVPYGFHGIWVHESDLEEQLTDL